MCSCNQDVTVTCKSPRVQGMPSEVAVRQACYELVLSGQMEETRETLDACFGPGLLQSQPSLNFRCGILCHQHALLPITTSSLLHRLAETTSICLDCSGRCCVNQACVHGWSVLWSRGSFSVLFALQCTSLPYVPSFFFAMPLLLGCLQATRGPVLPDT